MSIGTTRVVDVAIKIHGEAECYGVSNESYEHPELKNPRWVLGEGIYFVKARFRSVDIDQTFMLKFRNPPGIGPLIAMSHEVLS